MTVCLLLVDILLILRKKNGIPTNRKYSLKTAEVETLSDHNTKVISFSETGSVDCIFLGKKQKDS